MPPHDCVHFLCMSLWLAIKILSISKMAEIVRNFIVKFGQGFLTDTFRTYAAKKVSDEDLTEHNARDWVVRDLYDIKFKPDGLSHKDLLTSISFLKKGIQRLQASFECGNSSSFKLSIDEMELNDTEVSGHSSQTKQLQQSMTDAVALANEIRKLNIDAKGRFEAATESFKKAKEKATEAFYKTTLSTHERILATKVRIASVTLEKLDDPDGSATDCLNYLKELHALPAIKDIFSVHVEGGIKSLFKKDSRAEIVETVTTINLMLADFITKFTKRRMGILDWPMIECSKRVVHPIYYQKESVKKLEKMKITPTWEIALKERLHMVKSYAINSHADVIALHEKENSNHRLKKLDRETGEWKAFCYCPLDSETWRDASMAIDDDDTVYVVSKQLTSGYVLSVYSSDGTVTYSACPLDFIQGDLKGMTVTKEKIVCCSVTHIVSGQIINDFYCKDVSVYISDKTGKLIKSFQCKLPTKMPIDDVCVLVDKSGDIIVAVHRNFPQAITLRVFAKEGRHEKTIKLNSMISNATSACQVTFDHDTKTYFVYVQSLFHPPIVQCFSDTGELRTVLFLDIVGWAGSLVRHPNGAMAVVDAVKVYYFGHQ